MALADILEKIVKDAEMHAEELKIAEDNEVKKIAEKNEQDLAKQEKELAKRTEEIKAEMAAQALLQAKMNARTENLKQKRAIIEQALKETQTRLEKIDNADYEKLLHGLLKEISAEFTEAEITPATGREKETKNALKDFANLKLANTSGKFKGGFIAKAQGAEVDATFENLVMHTYRGQLELIISKELFA